MILKLTKVQKELILNLSLFIITISLIAYNVSLINLVETYKGRLSKAERTYKNMPNKYVGEFGITHYCSCPKCTGTPACKKARTSTGHYPKKGRTIAVDKRVIPLHSIVYLEGLGYFVAEDVGGGVKGNHIDIYVNDHQEALKLGTLGGKKVKAYILNNNY